MNLARLGAAALAVTAALCAPASALADAPLFNGRYDINGGSEEFYWDVTSNCSTEGCTASIASNRGWTTTATQVSGRWIFATSKPDGVICADGNYAPIVIRYSLDAATLAGYVTADSNGECPGGQVTQVPVSLVKVG